MHTDSGQNESLGAHFQHSKVENKHEHIYVLDECISRKTNSMKVSKSYLAGCKPSTGTSGYIYPLPREATAAYIKEWLMIGR